MKKILIILFLIIPFCVNAQTDREILLEIVKQQAKLAEQQAKLSEQIIATNLEVKGISTELKALDKSGEKRFDMLLYIMIGTSATLFAGIFGIMMMVHWDRRTAFKPFESKTDELKLEAKELKLENSELKKEIAIIKEKELKLELYVGQMSQYIKQISQIDNRFAPFNP